MNEYSDGTVVVDNITGKIGTIVSITEYGQIKILLEGGIDAYRDKEDVIVHAMMKLIRLRNTEE